MRGRLLDRRSILLQKSSRDADGRLGPGVGLAHHSEGQAGRDGTGQAGRLDPARQAPAGQPVRRLLPAISRRRTF